MNDSLPISIDDPEFLLLKYFVFQILFFLVLSLSYNFFTNNFFYANYKSNFSTLVVSVGVIKKFLYMSFLFSFVSFLIYFFSVGSLNGIIMNFADRSEIMNKNIFIQFSIRLAPFVLYASLFLYIAKKMALRTFFFYLLYVLISLLGFGSRTLAFTPLLGGIIMWCLCTNNMKIGSLKKFFLPAICFLPFFLIISDLRKPDRVDLFLSNSGEYINTLLEEEFNTSSFVDKQLSGVNISLFILTHYDKNNQWYGKGVVDLLFAPIPRSIYEEKSPVDEGRYITAAAQGMDFKPPTSLTKLPKYGWPPGSFGLGYINAGIVGILLFAFMRGFILSCICNRCLQNIRKDSFYYIVVYFLTIHFFDLTNLNSFNYLTHIMTFFIFYRMSKFLNLNKK
ncbi:MULTISPECIES: O-antigen polymerase [unclassified Parabacteroides]|uniref:O-antigen polymerase n=1 Tax=unclassified Parabacteroides TaxID=2649774 RepID=UPI0024744D39|nr:MULTISPECIES: O-antigen polymerase [unclassified Parabacteroides]